SSRRSIRRRMGSFLSSGIPSSRTRRWPAAVARSPSRTPQLFVRSMTATSSMSRRSRAGRVNLSAPRGHFRSDAKVAGRRGTLTVKNAAAFRTVDDGDLVDVQTITGGTGELVGTTGSLQIGREGGRPPWHAHRQERRSFSYGR